MTDLYHMCWALGFHISRINEKSLLELSLLLVTCSADSFSPPPPHPPLRKEGQPSCGGGRSIASLPLARSISRLAFVPACQHRAEKTPLFCEWPPGALPTLWSDPDEDLLLRHKFDILWEKGVYGMCDCCRRTRRKLDVGSCSLISTQFNCCWRECPDWESGPLKEDPDVSSSKFCLCSFGDGIGKRERRSRRVWSENDAPIPTNMTERCLAARSLAFWDLKKPPEKLIPPTEKISTSKSPTWGAGRRGGRGM